MKHFAEVLKFALRSQSVPLAVLLVGAVALLLVIRTLGMAAIGTVWQWLDAILGILTLGVATAVWFGEAREDWEETLPRRLKAVYLLAGQPVFICEGATLLAEGDLRALAQQLGRQMNGGRDLFFSLQFDPRPPCIQNGTSGPERLYEVHIRLTKTPETLVELGRKHGEPTGLRRIETGAGPREEPFVLNGPAAEAVRVSAAAQRALPSSDPN
ncbi:MAG: hypothetical protein HY735_35580 [Verrucomicrobia bacterium]|nr:hypothetical protein [Verrucomicrobiota bacterium]